MKRRWKNYKEDEIITLTGVAKITSDNLHLQNWEEIRKIILGQKGRRKLGISWKKEGYQDGEVVDQSKKGVRIARQIMLAGTTKIKGGMKEVLRKIKESIVHMAGWKDKEDEQEEIEWMGFLNSTELEFKNPSIIS